MALHTRHWGSREGTETVVISYRFMFRTVVSAVAFTVQINSKASSHPTIVWTSRGYIAFPLLLCWSNGIDDVCYDDRGTVHLFG